MSSQPAKKANKVVQQKLCFTIQRVQILLLFLSFPLVPNTNVTPSLSSAAAAAETTSVTPVIATSTVLCHEEPLGVILDMDMASLRSRT